MRLLPIINLAIAWALLAFVVIEPYGRASELLVPMLCPPPRVNDALLVKARQYVGLCESEILYLSRHLYQTNSAPVPAPPVPPDESWKEEVSDPDLDVLLAAGPKYVGKKITLKRLNIPLSAAIVAIMLEANHNVIVDNDVTGSVDLDIENIPYDQALDELCKAHGIDKVQEGDIIRVGRLERLRAEREMIRSILVEENTRS